MRVIYNKLSGEQKEIDIEENETIGDLKQKIKKDNQLKDYIKIILINNNEIKINYKKVDKNEYNIIYINEIEELKNEIKNKEYISKYRIEILIKYFDIEICKELKENIEYTINNKNHKSFKTLKIYNDYICTYVVKNKKLEMIKELEEIRYNFNINNIKSLVAYNEDVNVLKYFHESKGYKLDIIMYYNAIINNNYEIIKYLIKNEYIYNIFVFYIVILYDKINIIKYFDRMKLMLKPINFEETICNKAICSQSLKCLKYFYKLGYKMKTFKEEKEILTYKEAIKYVKELYNE